MTKLNKKQVGIIENLIFQFLKMKYSVGDDYTTAQYDFIDTMRLLLPDHTTETVTDVERMLDDLTKEIESEEVLYGFYTHCQMAIKQIIN